MDRPGPFSFRSFRLLWTGETTSCLGSSIGGGEGTFARTQAMVSRPDISGMFQSMISRSKVSRDRRSRSRRMS